MPPSTPAVPPARPRPTSTCASRTSSSASARQSNGRAAARAAAQIAGIDASVASLASAAAPTSRSSSASRANDRRARRLSQLALAEMRKITGLVDLDTSLKAAQARPSRQAQARARHRPRRQPPADRRCAAPAARRRDVSNWRAPDGENYDVNVRLPLSRPRSRERPGAPVHRQQATNADGSPRMVPLAPGGRARARRRAIPDQPARPDPRGARSAQRIRAARPAMSARHPATLDKIKLPPGYRFEFGGSTKNMAETCRLRRLGAGCWR